MVRLRRSITATGLVALLAVLEQTAFSQTLRLFEGQKPPEDSGWVATTYCDPPRSFDGGWLIVEVDACPGDDPPGGQQVSFQESLDEFLGSPAFFVEWRLETDGERSEIIGVAPASLVVGGSLGVSYHFTIARDELRVIRDNFLPIVFVETTPNSPHTYRLELFGEEIYVWFVDGILVDFGSPEGGFPQPGSVISWRSKSWYLPSTTAWDYVRFGVIPAEGSGDYDGDARSGLSDYYFLHECLINLATGNGGGPNAGAGPGCRFADFDGDSDVDLSDIAAFQVEFSAVVPMTDDRGVP